MSRMIWAGLLGLGMMASGPVLAQNAADTAMTKSQLKDQEKADKQQSKADKAQRKALGTKEQRKADKAQDKANKAAARAAAPPRS
jgi:hypothetical protein